MAAFGRVEAACGDWKKSGAGLRPANGNWDGCPTLSKLTRQIMPGHPGDSQFPAPVG